MARADWYRLDNIGKFYSAQAGHRGQTVFRFAAAMADEVDPFALQAALNRTVARYPGFNVSLRSGLFWHYLEPSGAIPKVHEENLPVCCGLHAGPKSVLFRVSFYRTRINLEVSHIIADGRGAFRFFRELLRFYVAEREGAAVPAGEGPADTAADRSEDSFRRHYDRDAAGPTPTERAYRLPGARNRSDPLFMEYHLPAAALVQWAHRLDVSVTALVIAAVICAIRATMAPAKRDCPIRMDVPVDLRQFFESTTMRNFFGLAFVSYRPGPRDEPLEAVAAEVQRQILATCTADAVKGRMNRMVSLERNPLLRWAPVFLKDAALEGITRLTALDVTTSVSSLGRIRLAPEVEPHVRSISLLTATSGLNFTVCTFGDDLCIGISSALVRPDALRHLCRLFSAAGIHGTIDSNLGAGDVGRRLREARLDGGLRDASEGAAASAAQAKGGSVGAADDESTSGDAEGGAAEPHPGDEAARERGCGHAELR